MTKSTTAELIARSNRLGSDPLVTNNIRATLILVCLPIVLGYFALQRFFELGLAMGVLK